MISPIETDMLKSTILPQYQNLVSSRKPPYRHHLHAYSATMTSTIGIPIKLLNEAQVNPHSPSRSFRVDTNLQLIPRTMS